MFELEKTEVDVEALRESLLQSSTKRELVEMVIALMLDKQAAEDDLQHARAVNNSRQFRSVGGVSIPN